MTGHPRSCTALHSKIKSNREGQREPLDPEPGATSLGQISTDPGCGGALPISASLFSSIVIANDLSVQCLLDLTEHRVDSMGT